MLIQHDTVQESNVANGADGSTSDTSMHARIVSRERVDNERVSARLLVGVDSERNDQQPPLTDQDRSQQSIDEHDGTN